MCQYHDSNHRVCAVTLNRELQQAHMELLSAHCATYKLRMNFSSEDLLRFGQPDVLRKSAQTASELNRLYASIEQEIPQPSLASAAQPTEGQIAQAAKWLSSYLRQQREHYASVASPLPHEWKDRLRSRCSPQLIEEVRFVELHGAHVSAPEFFAKVRAQGFEPPEITHMDSLSFINLIVFHQRISGRALFHALVHIVQIRILGLERYAELWVRGFIRTRAHFTVPLEVHAFSLASKFLLPAESFSVEDEVLRWMLDGRY